MPKTRKRGRPKKKARVTYSTTRSTNSTKNRNSTTKTCPTRRSTRNNERPASSNSETSPFKGFAAPSAPPKEAKLFGSLLSEHSTENQQQPAKVDLFDTLFNDGYKSRFHQNMKTYSNKKKEKQSICLLEFSDCKNRNDILQWLNDTRNVFDRLTQTQADSCDVNTQLTFDMPSVSQQTPVSKRPSRELKTVKRSPYKLRARSLDIQIKKNGYSGRNQRHSLAGDTPELENYQIEEVLTDEEVDVPAENEAKIILDLMEDEYLDKIEQEMQSDKKNHTDNGWDRIKGISKSLNRQPKQLKVVLKGSPKKEVDLLNNNNPSFDYDTLERYFVENMEKLMNEEKVGEVSLRKLLEAGKNFVQLLQKLIDIENRQRLHEFKPVVDDLKKIFSEVADVSIQTCNTYAHKNIQVEPHMEDVEIQATEPVLKHDKRVQTVIDKSSVEIQTAIGVETVKSVSQHDKHVQTVIDKCSVQIQTAVNVQTVNSILQQHKHVQTVIDKFSAELQTVNEPEATRKMTTRQSTVTSTTPSDIFTLNDEEKREISDAFDADFASAPVVTKGHNSPKSDVFDDDIDFDFNTEDILKDESKRNETREHLMPTKESVLVVSGPSKKESVKGIKRLLSESPVNDPHQSKRPCAQFIDEDLSVAFSEGLGVETNGQQGAEDIEQLSYNDSVYNHSMDTILKKYESTSPKVTPKTRTQEHIEELEEMIANVRRPYPPAISPKQIKCENLRNQELPVDNCKPSSYFSDSEKTPKKIRRNLFHANDSQIKISPNSLSESMFASEGNPTVVANQTLTEDNVDIMMKQVDESALGGEASEVDREVEDILKVHILDNVIVKRADSVKDEELSEFSDVDIVESTPQKARVPDFGDEREESALDVTLPPPIEFQDTENYSVEKCSPINEETNQIINARRPLAVINKVTSTPTSQRQDSENINLSPISCHGNKAKILPKTPHNERKKSHFSPIKQTNRTPHKSSNRENRRVSGAYELAQQHFSKFSPLTIIKKPPSQDNYRLNSTAKQKSILTYVRPSQESVGTPKSQKSVSFEMPSKCKPCIACSRVSKEEVIAISSLTNKKLATYSTSFSPKVTHLIVSTNEKNCLKDHTIKYVSAVASGIWVLSFRWVQQCLAKNSLVPEEPYEVFDVSGAAGPRMSRLTRCSKPLFKGYKIHAAAPFASTTQQEVENVIRMLGGKVVPSPEHLLDKNGYICVIVTEARATQDFDLYETWLEALKVVTVDIEWLSRSVGQYNLLSLRPFTLCSDDTIENLGYPAALTANMTYSFSQQTFNSVSSST